MLRGLREQSLLLLPALAVVVIAGALLIGGREHAVASARVYGGPTETTRALSWRIELFETEAGTPLKRRPLRVRASGPDGQSADWKGATDDEGIAEALVVLPEHKLIDAVQVEVRSGDGAILFAAGRVFLSSEDWLRGTLRRGGWIDGAREGPLHVRVAASRGVFAVPFSEPLRILVDDGQRVVSGAEIDVTAQAADVTFPEGRMTDSLGRLEVGVAPIDHSASLVVRARKGPGSGMVAIELPVLPGAMRATLHGDQIIVESPIERDVAYVSLTDGHCRLGGAAVPMTRDGRGGARGVFRPQHAVLTGALWAVLSSEADTKSMARVGWPLLPDAKTSLDPSQTLDVGDRLLLDGTRAAVDRERLRRHRVRALAGLFAVGVMVVALRLLFLRARLAGAKLERHLIAQGYDLESARRLAQTGVSGTRALFIALLCVALGFAALSLFALLHG